MERKENQKVFNPFWPETLFIGLDLTKWLKILLLLVAHWKNATLLTIKNSKGKTIICALQYV